MKVFYLKIGQQVKKIGEDQVMEVVGLEPNSVKNVITVWKDENGTIRTAKFMQDELELINNYTN